MISLAHRTWCFWRSLDKKVFVKFKISINFKQNIDETHLKQPKIHCMENLYQPMDLKKSQEKNPQTQKFQDFCQIFVISMKNHALGYGFTSR